MDVGSSHITESPLNVSVGSAMSSSEAVTMPTPPQVILGETVLVNTDPCHPHPTAPPQNSASSSSVSEQPDNIDADGSQLSVVRCENKAGDQDVGTQDIAETCFSTNPAGTLLDNALLDGDLMDFSSIFDTAIVPDTSVDSRCGLSFMGDIVEEKSQEPVSKDDNDISNNDGYNDILPGCPAGDNNPYASLTDFDFIIDKRDDCAVSNNWSHLTEGSTSSHSLSIESSSNRTADLDSPSSTGGTQENPIDIPDDENDRKPRAVQVLGHVIPKLELESTENVPVSEDNSTISTKSQETQRAVKRSRRRETQGSGVSRRKAKSSRRSNRLSGKTTDYIKYSKVDLMGRYDELVQKIEDVQTLHHDSTKALQQQKEVYNTEYERNCAKLQKQREKADARHERHLEELRLESGEFRSFLEMFG